MKGLQLGVGLRSGSSLRLQGPMGDVGGPVRWLWLVVQEETWVVCIRGGEFCEQQGLGTDQKTGAPKSWLSVFRGQKQPRSGAGRP